MYTNPTQSPSTKAGFLLVLVLVMGSVFLFIISSFIGYVVTQNQVINFRHEQQRATEIAEAGLNYYRWYLAHYPDDMTNGTGLPGPYVHQYENSQGETIGEFSLDITSNSYCGSVASIEVTSTGHTYQDPSAPSTVHASYARPTVAEYAVITNSGVWYGDSEPVNGPVHTNQGIRMDGAHNSIIASGQTDWTCTSSYGCSWNKVVDGVYTSPPSNSNPGLFAFPVAPVDFTGITLNLSAMKSQAQNNGGIFYGPTAGYGYSVVFNANGTADISRVNSAPKYTSYPDGYNSAAERNVITSETFLATETIDADCPLFYFEDKVWVKGDINQKVTLAAANLTAAAETNVVLNGNLQYVSGTNAGLLVVAEDNVDVGLMVPNNMTLDGIFIAQNGRFGRDHYKKGDFYWSTSYLRDYVIRNSLVQTGTVVSNKRDNVAWVSGGNVTSGFRNRTISFDRNQVNDPPPLTPQTSDVYSFGDWRQDG